MFSNLTYLSRAAAALMLAATFAPAALARDNVRAAAWTTITSAPGRFSVAMPGRPSYEHKTLSSRSGPVDFHSYIFDAGDVAYCASYSTYRTSNLDLDGCIDGLVNGFGGGRVLTSRNITYGRYSGREVTMANNTMFAKARVFAAGNHLYQTVVVTTRAKAGLPSIAYFLDSFQIAA
jgi:hypothetical protein